MRRYHPVDALVEARTKWYVMVSVGMGIFLSTIDGSIVNVALPSLDKALGTEFATVQWLVLAYLLTLATVILSMGRMGLQPRRPAHRSLAYKTPCEWRPP